ncbi:MAG: hypothetical protein LF885_06380 [Rickettsia endosymbiont of Culicoides impunctatus]|nr:MAG: hypothetical protein LF885_06380 [Rickettsia endosymbiont of Culicoides impunctatus]
MNTRNITIIKQNNYNKSNFDKNISIWFKKKENLDGIQKVGGSIPPGSTIYKGFSAILRLSKKIPMAISWLFFSKTPQN